MNSLLKIGSLSLLGITAITACGPVVDSYKAPAIGSELNWHYVDQGNTEKETVVVVANGPDYAIFRQPGTDADLDPLSYFVEFSGIEFAACDADMVTTERRQMFADAWPLTVGTVLKQAEYDISVEEESTFKLGEEAERIFNLRIDYHTDEPDDVMKFSPRLATVIGIDWGSGGADRLQSFDTKDVETTEIRAGHKTLAGLDVSSLGNCGKLLAEAN